MMNKKTLIKVNHSKIRECIEASPFNQKEICQIMGKNPSWLSVAFKKDYAFEQDDVERLASILRTNVKNIIEPLPQEQEPADDLCDILRSIDSKLDRLISLIDKPPKPQPTPLEAYKDFKSKPKHERAKLILQDLMQKGSGKCLRTDFVKVLLASDIGSSYVDQAIKDCGYEKGTTGLGKSTTVWILDTDYSERGDNDGEQ
jgi:hypothetical protein